jgi:hypothetical protein
MSLRGTQRRGNPKLLLENQGLFFFYIKKVACPLFIIGFDESNPYSKKILTFSVLIIIVY